MAAAEIVPRTIHYCWFGDAPMSELGRRCIESWRTRMPGFHIERWDDRRLDRNIPYVDMAYRARKFAFVADYVRLLALYNHGGLYFDTDVEVVRSFDELLSCPLFVGLETPDSIGMAVIGASPGSPLLRLLLDRLDAEARRGVLSYRPLPQLMTEVVRGDPAISPTLLPEECFYPYNPHSPVELRRKPLQSNISERTFSIHHWEGTWIGDASLRMLISLRLKAALRRVTEGGRRLPSLQAVR